MPEACYDPIRLRFSAWKKRLAGPIERLALRRCKKLVATCDAEKAWIEAYLGKKCPEIEVEDVNRFFDLSRVERVETCRGEGRFGCVNGEGEDFSRKDCVDGIRRKKEQIVYVGRLSKEKGVETLIKAYRILAAENVKSVKDE
jgi:glycosyltransferase involved in cell wall biosynthesis